MSPPLYRLFVPVDGRPASAMRPVIIVMIALACVVVFAGVVRVSRNHEVLRIGADLSRQTEQLRELRERNRALSVERATLTAPDRIRALATQLGMTTVAPDRIRVVVPHTKVTQL